MRFFTTLGISFYCAVIILMGLFLIGYSLHILSADDITAILQYSYDTQNVRLIIALTGLLLIIISLSFAQIIMGKIQQERTIAFSNPSGQVTIALSAVEDLLRRLTANIREIKETRPAVIATKKGINVNLRLVLLSETNIPELTSRVQELTKSKLIEILGVDESINVKIHVIKIISDEAKKKKEKEPHGQEPPIPFQSYGR